MLDINKYIINERRVDRDAEGNLSELEPWSEFLAQQTAKEEGIELTPEHWDVIHFLRQRFEERGQTSSGRKVMYELEDRYEGNGGKRYLYTLFPHGPVTQASRIAGLPLPAYTTDPSFGSAE